MDIEKLVFACKALKESPLFRLSLGSKELFHTNAWHWLLEKYGNIGAVKVFDAECSGNGIVQYLREKSHIDLTIQYDTRKVFIENKVKDRPKKEQLERYKKKMTGVGDNGIIVSPYKPFFNVEKPWRHVTYGDIGKRLDKFLELGTVQDKYHLAMIKDYINVITHIQTIADIMATRDGVYDFYWQDGDDEGGVILRALDKIKFADFYIKYRGSQLASHLHKHLESKMLKQAVKLDSGSNDIETSDIVIASSYNHNKSTVSIERVLKITQNQDKKAKSIEHITVGIQIEGSQYRYYIYSIQDAENKANILRAKCLLFPESISASMRNNNEFCKYDSKFYYRYQDILYGETYTNIAQRVTSDIKKILETDFQCIL